jgi:hypothetical protein
MRGSIWLSLMVAFLLLLLFPLLFANLMAASLVKLHLDPDSAVMLVVAIVIGGFINIPVRRIRHEHDVTTHPLAAFGMFEFWPRLRHPDRTRALRAHCSQCHRPEPVVGRDRGGCGQYCRLLFPRSAGRWPRDRAAGSRAGAGRGDLGSCARTGSGFAGRLHRRCRRSARRRRSAASARHRGRRLRRSQYRRRRHVRWHRAFGNHRRLFDLGDELPLFAVAFVD